MRLHISLPDCVSVSAEHNFKKGDRVICKIAKDEWYTGTVVRAGAKVKVDFDDDFDAIIDENDFKHIKPLIKNKKTKKALTDAEAKALYSKAVVKAKLSRRHWVVSDIHGCFDEFEMLMRQIKFSSNDFLFLLGDYIDRGPKSKQLLDYLMANRKCKPFKGNHEDMMVKAYDDPDRYQNWWIDNGGDTTLESFGVDDIRDVPSKYIEYLRHLPMWEKVGNFVLSHAGINLNHKDPFRDTETNKVYMLWNRNVKPNEELSTRIVVGHTPKDLTFIKKNAGSKKVMIDGGCAYGGHLVAFCLDDDSIVAVPGAGK